jgi:hypothetical protein
MTTYSEIQALAQAELDSVVGTNGLPTFDDRDSLPYINAICKDIFGGMLLLHLVHLLISGVSCHRCIAILHVASQDNIYYIYLIPKGSMVLCNVL